MEPTDLRTLTWRKSSYSRKLNCVEVARTRAGIAVRDSQDPDGPAILVSLATFGRFVASLL
jgi:hypothetical protein